VLQGKGGRAQLKEKYRDMVIQHYKEMYGAGYEKEIKKDMLRSKKAMDSEYYKDSWGDFRGLEIDIRDKDEKEKLIEEIDKEGWDL